MEVPKLTREKQAGMIAEFGRDVLGMENEQKPSEFRDLMMTEAGIYATDACLKHVFRNFDVDSNGKISAEELGQGIVKLRPASKGERSFFIIRKCLKYVPMYLSLFNLVASIWAAQTNLRERTIGDLYGNNSHYNWAIAAVSDFIGNFGYVFLELSAQKEAYEGKLLILNRFLRCVKSQIPTLIRKESFRVKNQGVEVRLGDDDDKGEEENDSRFSGLEKLIDDFGDKEFTELQLRRLFEKSDLYVSDRRFEKIYREIDANSSGTVSLSELVAFSKEKEEELYNTTEFEKDMLVLKKAIKKPGFYVSWFFTIGSVFWMLLALAPKSTGVSTITLYLQLTCTFYLAGAVGLMVLFFFNTHGGTEQVDYVDTVLRKTAIVFSRQDPTLDTSERNGGSLYSPVPETLLAVNEEISELDFDNEESEDIYPKKTTLARSETGGSSTSASTTREKASKRDTFLVSVREAMHTGFTQGLQKSLSLMHMDKQRDKESQRKGAKVFFKVVDIDESAEVDEMELFSSLVSLGMLVPTNVFSTIFRRIDRDGDGFIQLDEFVKYIGRIKPKRNVCERVFLTLGSMVRTLSFYLILVKVFAGCCQTSAAYGDNIEREMRQNLYLMGSFGWGVGSIYLLSAFPKAKGNLFDLIESTSFLFKEAIVKASLDHHMTKYQVASKRKKGKTKTTVVMDGSVHEPDDMETILE